MHKLYDVLRIEDLSKVEGHATLEIKIKNKKEVEDVKLMVEENRRFYQKAAVGKNILSLNQLLSRICGTCSAAHQFSTLMAIEKALNIPVSEIEKDLRKLFYYGNMIRDHAMHLYLFTLPDVFGFDSLLDFTKNNKEIIKEGFRVQEVGSKLSALIGGRAIHQVGITLKGITKIPSKQEMENIKEQLETIRKYVLSLIDMLFEWKEVLFMDYTTQGCLINKDFSFLEGHINIKGKQIPPEEYVEKHIQKIWKDYSHSYFYYYDNKPYLLGALSRLNNNKQALHKRTKKDTKKYLKVFPSNNLFHNNHAQAIEVLHCIDASIDILNELQEKNIPLFVNKELPEITQEIKTYSVIEAPRGLLYYMFEISKQGTIKKAEIITPTAQNIAHIEHHIKKIVEENISSKREDIINKVEMLIRSYDPCFSCASHFLKVRWKNAN